MLSENSCRLGHVLFSASSALLLSSASIEGKCSLSQPYAYVFVCIIGLQEYVSASGRLMGA